MTEATPPTTPAGQTNGQAAAEAEAQTRSPLDEALSKLPRSAWRPVAFTAILAIVGASAWAATVELDRVATARGVVAPQGQVRVVQHPEGGVVVDILTEEGAAVAEGAPLVRLDLGAEGLRTEEIGVRIDALRLERARLLAETQRLDLALPAEESARQPDLAAAERAAYQNRRRAHESTLALLRDQTTQKELEVSSIATRLEAARAKLIPLNEQMTMAARLIASGAWPRIRGVELERELKDIESEIAGLEASFPLAQTALAESRERELHERNSFRTEAAEQLRTVEAELARAVERRERADARAAQAVVTAPISGVVKGLTVNAAGAVVAPGAPIAEIVPLGEALVVEAQLSPMDIGHVAVGQDAVVKITTYDYLRYGALEGRITRIAADADLDPNNGQPYFRIIVATDRDALTIDDEIYPISPGMEAMVDLKLGRRSVASYLLEPVLKLRSEAFRDR